MQQILDAPRIMIDSDRILAQQVGLTQRDVANSLLISLTGSGATTTNFWLNYQKRRELPGRGPDATVPGGDRSTSCIALRSPSRGSRRHSC